MLNRRLRPLILVRGFGGPDISQEQASPYQGFNDGTVYPGSAVTTISTRVLSFVPSSRSSTHTVGGLVVRAALRHLTEQRRDARTLIHRIVTLGTPHRGIAFQMVPGSPLPPHRRRPC